MIMLIIQKYSIPLFLGYIPLVLEVLEAGDDVAVAAFIAVSVVVDNAVSVVVDITRLRKKVRNIRRCENILIQFSKNLNFSCDISYRFRIREEISQ